MTKQAHKKQKKQEHYINSYFLLPKYYIIIFILLCNSFQFPAPQASIRKMLFPKQWVLPALPGSGYCTLESGGTNLDEKGSIPKVFPEEFNVCLQQMLGRVVKRQGQRSWHVNVLQEGIFAELHSGEAWGTSALETERHKSKPTHSLGSTRPQTPLPLISQIQLANRSSKATCWQY